MYAVQDGPPPVVTDDVDREGEIRNHGAVLLLLVSVRSCEDLVWRYAERDTVHSPKRHIQHPVQIGQWHFNDRKVQAVQLFPVPQAQRDRLAHGVRHGRDQSLPFSEILCRIFPYHARSAAYSIDRIGVFSHRYGMYASTRMPLIATAHCTPI